MFSIAFLSLSKYRVKKARELSIREATGGSPLNKYEIKQLVIFYVTHVKKTSYCLPEKQVCISTAWYDVLYCRSEVEKHSEVLALV